MNQEERTAERPPRVAILRLLKRERERRGWSQSELAERIGTNQVTVSRWEHGTSNPSPFYRQQLAEVFGKSLEELGLFAAEEETAETTLHPSAIPSTPTHDVVLSPALWNVPYRRNAYFTGREDTLSQVYTALGSNRTAALTQAQAINGLGGIGKTQVAVEYAYRFCNQYSAVLWVTASSRETLISEFVMLAALLDLPEKDEQDQNIVLSAVKRWLTSHSDWLLILDNVDDLRTIDDILPRFGVGSVLLTTRLQALGSLAQGISVDKMIRDEGILFLLRRTKLLVPGTPLSRAKAEDQAKAAEIVSELDALPLALDQAGAYIEETRCGLQGYLTLYRTRQKELLLRRGNLPTDHPEPVATTWSISFQAVEARNVAAAELLRLLAFLNPESIPEEVLTSGAVELGPELGPATGDPFRFNEILVLLLSYSLIRRNTEDHSLSIHRLVQAVVKDSLGKDLARSWAERTIRALNYTFPEVRFSTWEQCRRILPHVLTSSAYLEEYHLAFPEAADLLNKAATYLTAHAQYEQAEPLLKKALAIRQHALDAAHHDSALALNDLGTLYLTLGKYQQAEPLLKEALEIRQKKLGSEHPDTAASLNNLAQLYHAQGKYIEAEQLYHQALQVREKVLETDHPDRAWSLNYLAELHKDQGQYPQAEQEYLQALDMQKRVLGPDHPDVAHTLNNLALVYRKQGAYAQAEQYYQKALDTQTEVLGKDHPDVAETLNNLAGLYRAQGAYTKAEPIYKEALEIREKVFGADHPLVAQSQYHLMKLYHSQGRYYEAERAGKQALQIQEQRLGKNHPDIAFTLSMLARIYQGEKQQIEAEELYVRALAIRDSTTGANHPHTALILNNLAEIYQARGDYEGASSLIKQSIDIRERSLGRNHLYMAYSLINLAEISHLMEDDDRAEVLFKEAISIREHNLGTDHPRTASAYHSLAKFYAELGRYEEAESLFLRALHVREQMLGAEHPAVATSLEDYSRFLRKREQTSKALEFEQRAETIRAKLSRPPP